MVDLQKELQTQRLLAMAEADNLAKCEQKLYAAEQLAGALRSLSAKQALRIDEMKLKYEPGVLIFTVFSSSMKEMLPTVHIKLYQSLKCHHEIHLVYANTECIVVSQDILVSLQYIKGILFYLN